MTVPVLGGDQSKRKLYSILSFQYKMLWQLGFMTQEIQSYSEFLWQILMQYGASCKQQQENVRLLEFRGKPMTFFADNYSSFEKYILAYYWILVGS